MFDAPAQAVFNDGRLHLQHGPIDLIIRAWGSGPAVEAAYADANARFGAILPELVAELDSLRAPCGATPGPASPVGRRMAEATAPFADRFITPMAAVAGSVADEIGDTLWQSDGIDKFYVNNGGDIAVACGPGQSLEIGMVSDLERAYKASGRPQEGRITISHQDGIGGIATSGWGGRSLSLGIADAVTVLAGKAAVADAAATLIANAVTVESAAVQRAPAAELDPDSDLGAQLVTVEVGMLEIREINAALGGGKALAEAYCGAGLIDACALALGGRLELVGRFASHAITAQTETV
jgi:ApbE superfamily uncharacterized protein (UPF0280 family)